MSRFMAKEPESTFFIDVFKIALGVFIGGLLAALAYTKIIALGVEQAAAEATASMQREMQKMKAQEEQERARRAAELQRLQQGAQARAAEQAAQLEERRRQQEEQVAFDKRREVAWKKSFKPTQLCQDDPLTTECIDTANISRRRFYAQYRE